MTPGPSDRIPDERPARRLIRRIVCAYRLGILPGDWLQTWRRLDRLLARSGFRVKVLLEPLEDLPDDVDLLVVSPELREAARAVVQRGVPLLLTTPATAATDFADLVRRLEAGVELTAERADPSAPDTPNVVTYRGSLRVD
jgi:hypothetical protein